MNVISPIEGKVVDLSELKDGVFSEKLMGDGLAILPKIENDLFVYAPISGTLKVVFHTGHAYGIEDENGNSILVHIGIDTVTLKGQGFEILVKQGDYIEKGQKLAKVNFKDFVDKVPSIAVIVLNMPDSKGIISNHKFGIVKEKDIIFTI